MRWNIRPAAVLAAVVMILTLTACETPGIDPQAAESLQAEVLSVTESAHDGDYQQALADLDVLAERVERAVEAGGISGPRQERIQEAMQAVRMELESLISAGGSGEPDDGAPAPPSASPGT